MTIREVELMAELVNAAWWRDETRMQAAIIELIGLDDNTDTVGRAFPNIRKGVRLH